MREREKGVRGRGMTWREELQVWVLESNSTNIIKKILESRSRVQGLVTEHIGNNSADIA